MKLSERTPASKLHKTCPICGSEEVDVSNDWMTKEMKVLAVFEKCWMCGWKRLVPKTEPLFSAPGTYERE